MKTYRLLCALGACLLAGPASAQATDRALDINLNDDTARLDVAWPLGGSRYRADLGYLHDQDRGDIVHAGFHLVDAAANRGLSLRAGLGLKLVHTNTDMARLDGIALALGGFFRYTLPGANRFNVGGAVYYAPDVVSFGDQSGYYEIGLRLGYSVIPDADVYVGIREIQAKYDTAGRFEFDSAGHLGFEFRF